MSQSVLSWLPRDLDFSLAHGEVQVWCIRLKDFTSGIRQLAKILSKSERERIERCRFERHKENFIISHGFLRMLLGVHLDVEPDCVCFSYGRYGKLSCDPNFHQGKDLKFNLAHSRDISLCTFARNSEVGVDVEFVHQLPDAMAIAKRYFSEREYRGLSLLPANQRTQAFYSCWTRKEAYLKALGIGLSRGLDHFSVSTAPGQAARLLQVEGNNEEVGRWTLKSWPPAPGYVAAVAVERSPAEFVDYQLPFNDA